MHDMMEYVGNIDLTNGSDTVSWIHVDINTGGGSHLLRWTHYVPNFFEDSLSLVIELQVETYQKDTMFIAVHVNSSPVINDDIRVNSLADAQEAVFSLGIAYLEAVTRSLKHLKEHL